MTTYGSDDQHTPRPVDALSDEPVHETVGAYALGLLDADEATAFEEHLAECERCGEQLEELVGMGPLLSGLADLHEPPGDPVAATGQRARPPVPQDLGPPMAQDRRRPTVQDRAADLIARPNPRLADQVLDDLATHRARRRRRGRYLVAAAAALIIAGPVATVAVSGSADQAPRPVTDSVAFDHMNHKVHATDAVTKVSATIGMKSQPSGTNAVLELSNVRGPLKCTLVAVGVNGAEETMATWSVTRWGYGIGGSKWPDARAPLYVHGSAAMDSRHIDHFEVRTADGRRLVSVDAQGA
jgi:anti-sigma factor RsiW